MSSTIQYDGNGRLWERFELANINKRIGNLYEHFKNNAMQSGSNVNADLNEEKIKQAIQTQLTQLIRDLESKYNQKTKPWKDENDKLKQKTNNLENRIRDLNRRQNENNKLKEEMEKKYNTLRKGLDQIINDSNNQNKNRIAKLQNDNKNLQKERDNLFKQGKKEKRQHEDVIFRLEEKYDVLNGKYKKETAERGDLLRDRDDLSSKFINLQNIIRENREHESNRLNEEMNILDADRKSLQNKYDALKSANNKLENSHRILCDKYDLEKEAFKKTIERENLKNAKRKGSNVEMDNAHREELRALRRELNEKLNSELKKRNDEWLKEKKSSIDTLDDKYREISQAKDSQIANLSNSMNELKKNLRDAKNEIVRLKLENEEIGKSKEEIRQINDKLNEKCNEITKLRIDLSKYKILWRHFFGLDAPLKDEIDQVNNKLEKFENYHNIKSPIPKKKACGRVVIESYRQWYASRTSDDMSPPLMIDTVPTLPYPEDKYQRFELYNMNNKSIALKGFTLQNDAGDIIKLHCQQTRPGGCIPIALRQKRHRLDILYNKNDPTLHNKSDGFCNFENGEKIYLCDNFDGKKQIFPKLNADNGFGGPIYDNLAAFGGEVNCPLKLKQFYNEDDGFAGFEFGNRTGQTIRLKNMYFKNKQNTFSMAIPFKALQTNGIIRLIATNNKNHPKISKNDLIVSRNAINVSNAQNDALLLCDSFNTTMVLYKFEGAGYDNNNNNNRGRATDCFIM